MKDSEKANQVGEADSGKSQSQPTEDRATIPSLEDEIEEALTDIHSAVCSAKRRLIAAESDGVKALEEMLYKIEDTLADYKFRGTLVTDRTKQDWIASIMRVQVDVYWAGAELDVIAQSSMHEMPNADWRRVNSAIARMNEAVNILHLAFGENEEDS